MEKNIRGGVTTHATVTNADRSKSEITDKKNIDAAILHNNESKYHMTEGDSKFLSPECVEYLEIMEMVQELFTALMALCSTPLILIPGQESPQKNAIGYILFKLVNLQYNQI